MPDGGPRFGFAPAAMDAKTAAYYVGLGEHAFLAQVAAGHAPQPIQATPRSKVWLREDLDLYLAALAGARPPVNWLDPAGAWRQIGAATTGW